MLKARRNATTPIGNCEDNWLMRVTIGAHVQTYGSVFPSFGRKWTFIGRSVFDIRVLLFC